MYVIPWIILMDLLYSEVIPEVGMLRTEVLGACAVLVCVSPPSAVYFIATTIAKSKY